MYQHVRELMTGRTLKAITENKHGIEKGHKAEKKKKTHRKILHVQASSVCYHGHNKNKGRVTSSTFTSYTIKDSCELPPLQGQRAFKVRDGLIIC